MSNFYTSRLSVVLRDTKLEGNTVAFQQELRIYFLKTTGMNKYEPLHTYPFWSPGKHQRYRARVSWLPS